MKLANPDIFNETSFEVQKDETFRKGAFFDVNSSGDRLISLYHYNDFLVEVHFNPFENEIEHFHAISIWDAADKYIDLQEILVEA